MTDKIIPEAVIVAAKGGAMSTPNSARDNRSKDSQNK